MTAPARGEGGEGGGGGGGGREGEGGGGGRGGEGNTRILVLPSHRQPKSIGGGETSPPDLGAHLWVHTEGTPPPPPRWPFCGVGVSGEGIKRWGIEGIRIGTSDRFGRGRGEYKY